ncbi:MAG: RNA polymerase sigma factor [Bacteroidales bacterium]|nr:RNA polymerase sigma factor [Bacteroidales bacterium]
MISEEILIRECKKHNRIAQKELYETYTPVMFGICIRYAVNDAEAKDIMQEGFIKIFSHIKQFKGKGTFEGWMKRIMINTAITHYHKTRKSRTNRNIDEVDATSIHEETQQQNEISDGIDRTDIDEKNINFDIVEQAGLNVNDLLSALNTIPEAFKLVFNLYCIEGYKHKDISEMLRIDEKTSRTRLSRARNLLQKKIYELSIKKVGK